MSLTRPAIRGLLSLCYLAAGVLLVDQVLILAVSLSNAAPGVATWRYGAVGLTVGRATPLLFADILILGTAALLGHRIVLRVWGVLHLLASTILMGVLVFFALDAIQVRQLLSGGAQSSMEIGAARAGIMLLLLAVFSGWAGWRLWSETRAEHASGVSRRAGLVVGQLAGPSGKHG